MHGKTIAALLDAFSPQYRANIGLEPNDIMFNSGVMLIDLKRWKERKVEERLLKFIESKHGIIQQGDQGALNAVLSHDTYSFEPRFNSVTIFYDFNYKELLIYRKPTEGYYDKESIQKAVSEPVIIHFTTSFLSKRPWVTGCQHRYLDVWLKYKELSPWAGATQWNDNTGLIKRISVGILKKLPRKVMIRICGLAQAYGRPWRYRFRWRGDKLDIKMTVNRALIAAHAMMHRINRDSIKNRGSIHNKTVLIVFQQIFGDSIVIQSSWAVGYVWSH